MRAVRFYTKRDIRVEDVPEPSRVLGASQVLVAPAPGESGKMPFWRGDGPGRPLEFGRAIGSLARRLVRMDREEAQQKLTAEHSLDQRAATR